MLDKLNMPVLLVLMLVVVSGCKEKTTITDAFKNNNVIHLINAALDNDVQELNNLISIGVDIDASGLDGITPLLWTVLHRDYDATEILLQAGADPDKASNLGDNALCIVAGEANTNLLELLLKYNANPNCLNRQNYSALKIALIKNRDKNIYLLVDAGADIQAHNGFGRTAAVDAAALGRMDMVEYFLGKGYEYDLTSLRKSIITRKFAKDSKPYEIKQQLLERLPK